MNEERNKLVEELERRLSNPTSPEEIANFIIADRLRIVEPGKQPAEQNDGYSFPQYELSVFLRTHPSLTNLEADLLAERICAKFCTPKPKACKCRNGKEVAMTVIRLDEGLSQCPRCGGIIVGKPKAVSEECQCVYESDCHGIEMIKSPSGKEWAIGGTHTKDRFKFCPWCGGTINL